MSINRNLYAKELKRNRRSLIIWSAIVIGLTIVVMSIFPVMKNMGDDMAKMMSKMPEGLAKAMGINSQTFNSILGMYNTYYGIYIIVLLSIYTASTGATIISKEESDKTAEFLLTKPISRKDIFNTKILALFTLALVAYALQTVTAVIFVATLGSEAVEWSVLATMHTHGLGLMLFFTSIGVVCSMLMVPRTNFMGLMVGVVFGTYFLNTIAKITDSIEWLGYFSPFYYLDFNIADSNYGTSHIHLVVILILSALLLVVSCRIYERKDIGA